MSKAKLMLIGGGALGGLLLFGAVFAWVATGEAYGPDRQLDLAMKLLDQGRWDLADRIARDVESNGQLTQARRPVWNYIRGVSGVLSTDNKLDSPLYRKLLWDASDFLDQSRQANFPLGYRARGSFYLGYCYFHTYAWEEAIENLLDAVDTWPQRRSDALAMMVEAGLRAQPPKRAESERYLDYWSKIPGLSTSERNRITLSRAHLAFLDGDWTKVEKLLESIPASSVEYYAAKLGRGRWKLEAARQTNSKDPERFVRLEQALADFREVLVAPPTPADDRRQASYLVGQTLRELGRFKEAVSTLSGVRQRNPQSAEAIAAGISEAEIQLEQNKTVDALETARHVVNDIGDTRLYDERWLTLDELRRRLMQLGRDMRESGDFESANRLASYLPPVFPVSNSVRLEAENYEAWGLQLENQPVAAATSQARNQWRSAMEAKFILAGDKYRELSRLELRSTDYPAILWRAIECYQKASQLDKANEILKDYLLYEDRAKRPRGLLALGRNYLNAGRWKDVLPPLQRCLTEYPEHPSNYEVRLVMARALTEQSMLEDATDMLMGNLYDGNLKPDSQLWRDSLFELGNVIYRRGDELFLEGELTSTDDWNARLGKLEASHKELIAATERLSEAVARFDRDRRALDARYAIGRAYRTAAMFPKQLLDSGRITIDSVRRKLLVERRQLLESALAGFRDLHEALGDSPEPTSTDPTSTADSTQTLLRNCFFGEADVLYDLGQYEDAIAAYRNVGNRFMNEPEALEALMQISECFRQLGQPEQARRTLIQAEQLLARIPDEANPRFATVTRANRAQWQQLLAWLKK